MYPLAVSYPKSQTILITRVVDAIGANKLHQIGVTGRGIKVAVLDTGVSMRHPMISPNIIRAESMIDGEGPEDGQGHGSWVASAIAGVPTQSPNGLLYGVAPDAKLIIIKVLSNNGSGSMAGVVRGMERAVELGADIISMSLGAMFGTNMSPDSRTLNTLAEKYGTLFIVAAGNAFAPFTISSPSCAAACVSVGSISMCLPVRDAPSTFSSKGPTLDGIIKPNISTYGGNVAAPGLSELLYAAGKNSTYSSLAGTSMATPIVSGALALLLSAGVKKDRLLIEELFARTGGSPLNPITGWGVLNVEKLYQTAASGILPMMAVAGNIPYILSQPMFRLMPKPERETLRLQVMR